MFLVSVRTLSAIACKKIVLPHVLGTAKPHEWTDNETHNNGPIAVGETVLASAHAEHDGLQILGSHDNAGHSHGKDAQVQQHRYQQAHIGSIGQLCECSIWVVAFLQY